MHFFPMMKKSFNVSGKTALIIMPVFGEHCAPWIRLPASLLVN